MYLRISFFLGLLVFILAGCENSENNSKVIDSLTKNKISQNFKNDSSKSNRKPDSALIIKELKQDSIKTVRDTFNTGIVYGIFKSAEEGDYWHINLIDTNKVFWSFYVSAKAKLPIQNWDRMLKGDFKNKKVIVSWERKRKYIREIEQYEIIESATKIIFQEE